VINPSGLAQIVGIDPKEPDHLPNQHLFDLHLSRAFKAGGEGRNVVLVLDGFNIFNSDAPLNIDAIFDYGKVRSIPQSRRFRFGARYEF
jgi:hypothetical protein